jgi:hypothetical protein
VREEQIRERTVLLLEAYRDLTGDMAVPGIPDFLLLRSSAINELGLLNRKKVDKKEIREGSEALAMRPVKKEVDKSSAEKSLPGKTEGIRLVSGDAALPEEDAGEEVSESDFDILRKIKDPWN